MTEQKPYYIAKEKDSATKTIWSSSLPEGSIIVMGPFMSLVLGKVVAAFPHDEEELAEGFVAWMNMIHERARL